MDKEFSNTFKAFQTQFGLYIRQLRRERGWSQDDLSSYANIAKPYISTLERGLSKPGIDTLLKLATAFGLEVSDLFRFQFSQYTTPELKCTIRKLLENTDDNTSPDQLFYKIIKVFMYR